jgi:hypothetical protein
MAFAEIKNSLGWEVNVQPCLYKGIDGNLVETKHKAITRSDNGLLLGIRGNQFTPMLVSEFEELKERIGEVSGFEFKGYSEFYKGGVIMANFQSTTEMYVDKYAYNDHLIMGNSYNGEKPFFLGTNTEMIRCSNQFSKITVQSRIRNTKNGKEKREELVRMFEIYCNEKEEIYKNFKKFQDREVSPIEMELIKRRLFSLKKEDSLLELPTRTLNRVAEFDVSMAIELGDLGDNLLGWFNGCTRFSTYSMEQKESCFGNLMGSKNDFNQKAYNLALEMVM